MPPQRFGLFLVVGWLTVSGGLALAQSQEDASRARLNIRAFGGMRIVGARSIRPPGPALRGPIEAAPGAGTYATMGSTPPIEAAAVQSTPYPRPPLAGFSPLVAMTTSDKRSPGEDAYEHVLHSGYPGTPLNPPADANFIVGVFDSGSGVDIVFEPFDVTTGLVGGYVTSTEVPIGGVGGTVTAYATEPVGLFMASLDAIDPATSLLDLGQVVGHSNNSMLVAPEINCGGEGGLTAAYAHEFEERLVPHEHLARAAVAGRSLALTLGMVLLVLLATGSSLADKPGPVVRASFTIEGHAPSDPQIMIPLVVHGNLSPETKVCIPLVTNLRRRSFPVLSESPVSVDYGPIARWLNAWWASIRDYLDGALEPGGNGEVSTGTQAQLARNRIVTIVSYL